MRNCQDMPKQQSLSWEACEAREANETVDAPPGDGDS